METRTRARASRRRGLSFTRCGEMHGLRLGGEFVLVDVPASSVHDACFREAEVHAGMGWPSEPSHSSSLVGGLPQQLLIPISNRAVRAEGSIEALSNDAVTNVVIRGVSRRPWP